MFNEMMQRSDQLFFDQSGVADDRIMSLPSYLDALASITQQLDEVGFDHLMVRRVPTETGKPGKCK